MLVFFKDFAVLPNNTELKRYHCSEIHAALLVFTFLVRNVHSEKLHDEIGSMSIMSFKFCYCSKPLFCSYLQCYKKNFKSSEQVVVVLDIWSFENMVSENFCGSDLNAEYMVRFKEWNGMLTSFFNTLSLIAWRRGHSKSGMICPFRIWEYILNHFF